MAKVLIMYFSKYGSTRKYAEWIASELDGDVYNIKNIKQNILGNYETIKNKKMVLFTCGVADYSKMENIK